MMSLYWKEIGNTYRKLAAAIMCRHNWGWIQ